MSHTIFYFTGTGNSLKIAQDIATKLKETSLISIAKSKDCVTDFIPEGKVGFVFPVYYCGLPQIVHEFISKIKLSKANYIYIVATYGATGGNGGCISQAKRLLADKGKVLNAGFYTKSVDNFILWTWDIPAKKKQAEIHSRAYKKAKEISQIVHAEKKHIDMSFVEHIGPIIFRHQHFHETVNKTDQAFYSTPDCTSCGLCAKVCPTKNIDLCTGKPKWKSETCQRCLACLHLCPVAAIQYGKVTIKRHRYKNPYIAKELFVSK